MPHQTQSCTARTNIAENRNSRKSHSSNTRHHYYKKKKKPKIYWVGIGSCQTKTLKSTHLSQMRKKKFLCCALGITILYEEKNAHANGLATNGCLKWNKYSTHLGTYLIKKSSKKARGCFCCCFFLHHQNQIS